MKMTKVININDFLNWFTTLNFSRCCQPRATKFFIRDVLSKENLLTEGYKFHLPVAEIIYASRDI